MHFVPKMEHVISQCESWCLGRQTAHVEKQKPGQPRKVPIKHNNLQVLAGTMRNTVSY